jgi:hypothetical protein
MNGGMSLRPAGAVLFVILASCSRSQPGASEAPSASPASASVAPPSVVSARPAASVSAAPPDPSTAPSCAFVTKAEAEATLGETIAITVLPANGLCEYFRASEVDKRMKLPLVTVAVQADGSKSAFEAWTQNAANMLHEARTPRPGFGEEAFQIGSGELGVWQHGRSIAIARLQTLDAAKFDAFSRKAATHL